MMCNSSSRMASSFECDEIDWRIGSVFLAYMVTTGYREEPRTMVLGAMGV
jgi:hypothetical protein